jgi:hypothetical protein
MNETRETANAAMHQAIPGLVADIASGRVEDSRSFSQKNSQREFFCEKDKQRTMLPQANRSSGLAPGRNQRHRVTPVLKKSTTRKDKRSG